MLGFTVAFTAMIVGMTVVFAVVYARSGSMRRSILAALVMGKAWALALWALGIDRPVIRFYLVRRDAPWLYREVSITANELILASYLATFFTILLLPVLLERAPPELKRLAERVRM